MAYFPFYVDIKGKNCLVVGGGKIALQKIQVLISFEVFIKVISPYISKEILDIKDYVSDEKMLLLNRNFQESDIDGCLFVVAATDDSAMNAQIAKLCRDRNILVNVVDLKEECSFIFPAVIKKKDLVIAVSSSGTSPALTVKTKKKIEMAIPDFYPDLLETLGEKRNMIRARITDQQTRKKVYQEIIALAENIEGNITENEIESIITGYLLSKKGECTE